MSNDDITKQLQDRGEVAAPAMDTPAIMQAISGGARRDTSIPRTMIVGAGALGLLILFFIGPLQFGDPGASSESTMPPGSAASVLSSSSPGPSSSPSSSSADEYVVVEGYGITVLENQDADGLFEGADECRTRAGYSLLFPRGWRTNPDLAGLPACSWFGPTDFDVPSPALPPKEIWIRLKVVDGTVGYTSHTDVFYEEQLSIGGRSGRRAEFHPEPTDHPELTLYHYIIPLDGDRTFVAETDTNVDDYGLVKAILDRMMGSLSLTP